MKNVHAPSSAIVIETNSAQSTLAHCINIMYLSYIITELNNFIEILVSRAKQRSYLLLYGIKVYDITAKLNRIALAMRNFNIMSPTYNIRYTYILYEYVLFFNQQNHCNKFENLC